MPPSLEGALLGPPLNASSNHHPFHQSIEACIPLSSLGGLVDPRMRASNEHLLSVRVPRAGGRPGCPPPPITV